MKYNSTKIVRYDGTGKTIEYEALKSLALYSDMDNKKQVKWRKKLHEVAIIFDSKKEYEFYEYLLDREKRGEINDIRLQPVFILQRKNERFGLAAITYKLDFGYYDRLDEREILVDVKGMATEVAKIKRKLLLAKIDGAGLDMQMLWLVKFKGEWVDYFANEARKAKNRKDKKKK